MFDTLGEELGRIGVKCAVAILEDEQTAIVHHVSFQPSLRAWLENRLGHSLIGLQAPRTCLRPWRVVIEQQAVVFREPADVVADVLLAVPDLRAPRAFQLLIGMTATRAAYLPLVAVDNVLGVLVLWSTDLRHSDMPAYTVLAAAIAHALQRRQFGRSPTHLSAEYETLQRLSQALIGVLEALRKSELRYRSLFDNIPVGLYRSRPDGTILEANPAMVEMFGYPDRETLIATNARTLYVDPGVRRRWRAKLAQDGVVHGFDMQLRRFDGSMIWVQSNARAVTEDGTLYYEGALKDITTQKRDDQLLQGLAEDVVSETGARFFASLVRRLAKNLGMEYAFVGELVANKTRIRTAAVFADGTIRDNFAFDLADTPCQVLVRGNDDVVYFPDNVYKDFPESCTFGQVESYMGVAIAAADGTQWGVLGVLSSRQLTRPERTRSILQIFATRAAGELERLRSEAQLNKLSQIVEQTADIVYITDPEGIFEYVNPTFERVTGFSRNEIYGQPSSVLKSGVHAQSFYDRMWKTIRAGRVFRAVVVNRKKSGALYYEEKTITPMLNQQGEITHFISTGKDITGRRRAEQARARVHRAARRRLERLETLYAVAQAVIGVRDLSALLESALECILALLPADAGSVYLRDTDGENTLSLAAHCGFSEENMKHFSTHRVGDATITGSVARTGDPLLIEDTTSFSYNPDDRSIVEADGIQSHAAMPLCTDEQVIGVLNLVWHRQHSLDSEALDLLRGVAGILTGGVMNARLYEAEQTRRQELSALYTLSRELSSVTTTAEVLKTSARHLVETTHVTFCRILLRDGAGGLTCRASHAAHQLERPLCPPEETKAPAVQAFYRSVMEGLEPVIVRQGEKSLTEAVRQYLPLDIAAWLCLVPLTASNETLGVLCVGEARDEDREPLDPAKRRLITSIADQVAITIENMRLFEAVKEQREHLRALAAKLSEVEEAERQRLSRELHDQVGQNLSALNLSLNLVRAQLPADAVDPLRHRLDDALQLVEQTIERSRDVMAELRPPVLDDYGLVAALRWYGERFARRTNVAVSVQGEDLSPRLDSAVEIVLFRIAQEALSNVAKHAQATTVQVIVETVVEPALVQLVVVDDGIGFDSGQQAAGNRPGWGLSTMADRAESVGGSCHVESQSGAGTHVIVEVPR